MTALDAAVEIPDRTAVSPAIESARDLRNVVREPGPRVVANEADCGTGTRLQFLSPAAAAKTVPAQAQGKITERGLAGNTQVTRVPVRRNPLPDARPPGEIALYAGLFGNQVQDMTGQATDIQHRAVHDLHPSDGVHGNTPQHGVGVIALARDALAIDQHVLRSFAQSAIIADVGDREPGDLRHHIGSGLRRESRELRHVVDAFAVFDLRNDAGGKLLFRWRIFRGAADCRDNCQQAYQRQTACFHESAVCQFHPPALVRF